MATRVFKRFSAKVIRCPIPSCHTCGRTTTLYAYTVSFPYAYTSTRLDASPSGPARHRPGARSSFHPFHQVEVPLRVIVPVPVAAPYPDGHFHSDLTKGAAKRIFALGKRKRKEFKKNSSAVSLSCSYFHFYYSFKVHTSEFRY